MCSVLNTYIMVIYSVTWQYSHDLAKGKGKVTKNENLIVFSVLCRNSNDALSVLSWYFKNEFKNSHGLSLDDGEISLKRSQVDSRNFNPLYLFMDGIRMPLYLPDLKGSLIRYSKYL